MPEPLWFNCKVEKVGSADTGQVFIFLRDLNGNFSHWFIAVSPVQREMLSTALTAISTGLTVEALVATTNEYDKLLRLYVTRNP